MTNIVHFQGGQAEAARIIRAVIGSVVGSRQTEVARSVYVAIGFAALSDIQADFIVKARGGVGEFGGKWKRLSKKYLAYQRRFGPGEKVALKAAAGLGRAHHLAPGGKDGLLSKEQLQRWRQVYSQRLARYMVSTAYYARAQAYAAMDAWTQIKAEGGQTKLEVYGNRTVEILRDTSVLFNSLSLGEIVGGPFGSSYTSPRLPGGEEQIFQTIDNGIIVGTNVKYAAVQNYGYAKKNIPARPFIPDGNSVPASWLARWLDAGMQALSHAIGQSLALGGAY